MDFEVFREGGPDRPGSAQPKSRNHLTQAIVHIPIRFRKAGVKSSTLFGGSCVSVSLVAVWL